MGRHSCCTKQKLRKGLWSPEEDEKLFNYISRFGVGCWSSVPKLAGLQRCGKSCRLRWINYLRPDLKRGMFSQQEEDLIINLHKLLGNRWAQIAAQLPGRTDNEIKNLWNSSLKKKLMKQGIDPTTHQPLEHQLSPPASKNDTVSSSNDTNNNVLPPKPQHPIFLDTFPLPNNDQFLHHYGSSHLMSNPLQHPPFEPRLEPMGSDSDRGMFASQDHGFGLPCLASVDQSVEFSSSSYGSISSNVNMGEMNSTGGFSEWDHAKLESLFQYDDLDEFEDRKPENPWQMEGMISLDEDEQHLSGYPMKFMPEELGSTNFDVFQQL